MRALPRRAKRFIGQEKRQRGEEGEPRRHRRHGEGHEPPELGDVDKERGGDPIEPGDKEAETEAPAEQERIAPVHAAVEEPDKAAEGDDEDGRDIDRAAEERGEIDGGHRFGRQRTQDGSETMAPPAGKAGDPEGGAL
jgi:hypothetical protein